MTPEIIKKMCEIAEGFDCSKDEDDELIYFNGVSSYVEEIINGSLCGDDCSYLLPLLIHRAVEGWNKKHTDGFDSITIDTEMVNTLVNKYPMPDFKAWHFKDYQSTNLTPCEQAILDCFKYIFEEEK